MHNSKIIKNLEIGKIFVSARIKLRYSLDSYKTVKTFDFHNFLSTNQIKRVTSF